MKITKKRIIASIIVIVIVALAVAVYVWLYSRGNQIARDMQRVSDIQAVQAAFEMLFIQENTYEPAALGCPQVNLPVHACSLEKYLPDILIRQDPGEFVYSITQVPNAESYEVTFTLERGIGALGAGQHKLNHNGIQ